MNQYFEGFTEDYELTCGQNAFTVKKFEVFQLNFENNWKFNKKNIFNIINKKPQIIFVYLKFIKIIY